MTESELHEARALCEAWLTRHACAFDVAPGTPQYTFCAFSHPELGGGVLEWVDDPTLSQGGAQCALSFPLPLPPIQSVQDAETLFSLSDWLSGVTLVSKDFGSGALTLSVQAKCPLEKLKRSPESLDALFRSLKEALAWFSEAEEGA